MKTKELTFDPRGKLAAVCLASIAALWADAVAGLAIVAVFVITFGLTTGSDFLHLGKRLRSVFWFVVVIIGLNAFTRSGEVIWEGAGLFATREGLEAGLFLSARISLLLASGVFFVQSTPLSEMTDSIGALMGPLPKRAGPLFQILIIALHFVPLLIQTARRIKMVQIARGADVETRFAGQVRFANAAVVPLFVSSLRSSEQLALAMDARGYDPSTFRSCYADLTMHTADWLMVIMAAACCITALSL